MAQLTTSWQKFASAYLGQTLYVHLYMRYTQQDVANNRSYVEYACNASHDSYIYDMQGSASVGGSGASDASASIQTIQGEVNICNTGGWVNHASDGSGSVYGRADLSMPNWGWWNRAEAYATLPTIPRASTISTNVSKMGKAGNIYISRAASSFTHTITYSFGNASGTITTKTSSTTVSWTPATTLAAQVPNGTYGTCTLTCYTYSGNTLIGTKTTTFTLYISDSTVPSLTSITAAQSGNATAIGWGVYVQGKSKATVTFNGAAAGYGSTIQSYKVVCDSYNDTTSPFETDYLTSGTRTIYGYVYDKRGRSVYKTTTVTVQPYALPYLTNVNAKRSTQGGTPDDEGSYLTFSAKENFSSCAGHNSVTLAYQLLNASGGLVEQGTFTSETALTIGGSLAINQSYKLKLTITDALGESQDYEQKIETASVAMNIKAGGTAVAFGKYATEDETVEVKEGWDLYVGQIDYTLSQTEYEEICDLLGISY